MRPNIAAWAFALIAVLGAALPLSAQTLSDRSDTPPPRELELEMVWAINGGPYGSSRKLDPTIAITPDTVFVDAMVRKGVPKGDRSREVIRAFSARTGKPGAVIQHPGGEAFEGLGDNIAANAQFTVTGISGKAQFGRGGELLVYDTASLKLLRRIKSPRGPLSQFFTSTGIALVKDRILAAVPQTNDNISTAWVFDANTGKVLLTIDEPDVPDARLGRPKRSVFGRAVAMNERYIAVSANGRTGRGGIYAKGIVYIFDARDGSLLHRLTAPQYGKSTQFGVQLAMSDDRLFATSLQEEPLKPSASEPSGRPINWPVSKLHAFNLATGALEYTLSDPGTPESIDDVSAGNVGWGFGNVISVDGGYLISAISEWLGSKRAQGGLIVFDEKTGEQLLHYGHESGPEGGRFGKTITARGGLIAVMQEITDGRDGADRVALYRLKERVLEEQAP